MSLWTAVLVLAVGLIYLLDALLGWKLGFWTVLRTTALTIYGLRGMLPRFRFFRLGCLFVGLYSLWNPSAVSVKPWYVILKSMSHPVV